jgi:hypothetical protein
VKRIAVVCTDLVFRSQVREAIRAGGHEPIALTGITELSAGLDAAVIDLNDTRLDPFTAITALARVLPREQLLGFGSHVRPDVLDAGREAGCGLVMARSKAIRAIGAWLRGESTLPTRDED